MGIKIHYRLLGGLRMDFAAIVEFALNQGIWCALFVWLFYTSRQESLSRETKLTTLLESQGEKLTQISTTLDKISDRLNTVEEEVHNLEDNM